MEITEHQFNTAKRKKQQVVKQVKGRKRVRQLADSSSNEDEDFDRLPPSQITPQPRRAAAVKALLSSSEENLEVSALDLSPAPCKIAKSEADNVHCNEPSKTRVAETQKSKSSQGFEVSFSDSAHVCPVENSYAESIGKDWDEGFSTTSSALWLRKSLSTSKHKPCPVSSTVNQEVKQASTKFLREQTHLLSQQQAQVKENSLKQSHIAAAGELVARSSSSTSVVSNESGKDLDRETNDATHASGVTTKTDDLEFTGKVFGTKVNTSSRASTVVQANRPNVSVDGGIRLCANPASGKNVCGGGGDADQQKLAGVPQSVGQQSSDSGSRFTSIVSCIDITCLSASVSGITVTIC